MGYFVEILNFLNKFAGQSYREGDNDKKEEFYRNQTEESILSYLKDTGLVFATVNMSEDVKKDHIDRYVNAVLVKTGA